MARCFSGIAMLSPNGYFIFDKNGNIVNNQCQGLEALVNYSNYNGGSYGGWAVDEENEWIYYNLVSQIFKLDYSGKIIDVIEEGYFPALAVDPETGNLWCVCGGGTVIVDKSGKRINDLDGIGGQVVAYDKASKAFWIGGTTLYKVATTTEVLLQINQTTSLGQATIASLAVDPIAERVWVTKNSYWGNLMGAGTIVIYNLNGEILNQYLPPSSAQGSIITDINVTGNEMAGGSYGTAGAIQINQFSGSALITFANSLGSSGAMANHWGMFTVEGDYASLGNSPNLQFGWGPYTFDETGNLWMYYYTSSGSSCTFNTGLYCYDWQLNQLISNNSQVFTQNNITNLNCGYFIIPLYSEKSDALNSYLEIRGRLIENYQLSGGALVSNPIYRVEIKALQNNLPIDTPITLWSEAAQQVVVKGSTVTLSPTGKQTWQSGTDGKLIVDISATDLNVPSLFAHAGFMTNADECLVINAAQQLHNKMATISGTDLQAVPVGGGPALLPSSDYTAEQAEQLSSAIRNVMSVSTKSFTVSPTNPAPLNAFVAGQNVAEIIPSIMYRESQQDKPYLSPVDAGLAFNSGSDIMNVNYLPAVNSVTQNLIVPELMLDEPANWSLDFSRNGQIFTNLTYSQANQQAIVARAIAGYPNPLQPNFSLGSLVRDFLSGAEKVVSVVVKTAKQVVNTVVDGVKEIVHRIEVTITNIANQVADFVVRTVNDAVGFVKGIFNQIGIGINKVIDFFKFMFNWDDILYTQKIIKHQIDQLPQVITEVASKMQTILSGAFGTMKSSVKDSFASLRGQLGLFNFDEGDSQGEPRNDLRKNIESNWLMNLFMDNIENASDSDGKPIGTMDTSVLSSILTRLETLSSNLENNPGFNNAKKSIAQITQNPSQLPQIAINIILGIMEGLTEVILDVTDTVLQIMLDLFKALINEILGFLTRKIHIPVVSELYERFIDSNGLSIFGIVSVLLAVPTTVIYKILTGRAPFTKEEVDSFSWYSFPNSYFPGGLQANILGSVTFGANDSIYEKFAEVRSKMLFCLSGILTTIMVISEKCELGGNLNYAWINMVYVGLNLCLIGLTWDQFFYIPQLDPYKSLDSESAKEVYLAMAQCYWLLSSIAAVGNLGALITEKFSLMRQSKFVIMELIFGVLMMAAGVTMSVFQIKQRIGNWGADLTINIAEPLSMVLVILRKGAKDNPIVRIGYLLSEGVLGGTVTVAQIVNAFV